MIPVLHSVLYDYVPIYTYKKPGNITAIYVLTQYILIAARRKVITIIFIVIHILYSKMGI